MFKGGDERFANMSIDEIEKICSDPDHPLSEDAQRFVSKAMEPVSKSMAAMLRSSGLRRITDPLTRRPTPPPQPRTNDLAAAQQAGRVFEEAMRVRQEELQAEKDALRAEREAERKEARRQYRTMLGWTIASVGVGVLALVGAVLIAVFTYPS